MDKVRNQYADFKDKAAIKRLELTRQVDKQSLQAQIDQVSQTGKENRKQLEKLFNENAKEQKSDLKEYFDKLSTSLDEANKANKLFMDNLEHKTSHELK